MLYEFQSRATGRVTMTEPVGRQVLEAIGKPAEGAGILTVAQIPAAIAALQAAAAADTGRAERAAAAHRAAAKPDDDDEGDERAEPTVPLAHRVAPLVAMLNEAAAAGEDVVWGV